VLPGMRFVAAGPGKRGRVARIKNGDGARYTKKGDVTSRVEFGFGQTFQMDGEQFGRGIRGWVLYDDSCGFCRTWVPFWRKTVTFDLFAIEAADPSMTATSFTGMAGLTHQRGGFGTADFWVFVDGPIMQSRINTPGGVGNPINAP
jgi:hypothetical protein